jgi:superfamily II DNA or RNA helicase
VLETALRERKKNGDWSKLRTQSISHDQAARLPESLDRQILSLLEGPGQTDNYSSSFYSPYYGHGPTRYRIGEHLLAAILPLLARTERLRLRSESKELHEVSFDAGPAWELVVAVRRTSGRKHWTAVGELRREQEFFPVTKPELLVPGIVFWDGRCAPFNDQGAYSWVGLLRRTGEIKVPLSQGLDLVERLVAMPESPRLDLPEELRFTEESVAPQARLIVRSDQKRWATTDLIAELSFVYDGHTVCAESRSRGHFQADRRRLLLRDLPAERTAARQLERLGVRRARYGDQQLKLAPKHLPKVVRELVAAGWQVEAEGKLYKQPSAFRLAVSTGQDWFDLEAAAEFDGHAVPLPRLLEALARGETSLVLDDGTLGMVPEDWLRKYGLLAKFGTVEGDSVRFGRAQVGVLDALLASRPEVTFDQQFAQARDELRKFEGVTAVDPPAEFAGALRGYQREGLGWLQFLRQFGFGGCLADDMGLGKTVQVLALLAERQGRPALVVVPRSLEFNWLQEAARFAPQLRVLSHTGTGRDRTGKSFKDYDVVLTTYGTLRNDVAAFSDIRFDTCILDESQAAKNADTETSKAVRLVQADHRLALSGTPVENHLGELWTLFEFLNPGMLGKAGLFAAGSAARNPDPQTRELLAQALRPFILRRTKEQVANDLPAKTEQTLYCDLQPDQRRLYNELRDHYRQSLLTRIEAVGLARTKIQVLEALLRLRQAACHPGLIDKKRVGEDSAKLDVLLPQLQEIVEEGHKALVFSQFTSLLAIVRQRLDAEGVPYEYLDGRTRDRAARVERFQTDPDCRLFLVSLKAGGVGLNLTAAEYVFLLDPWWNPAVEAQAIDRTHRIGQTKPVFAYRLIARDTVEEKVVALQQTKRELADAILSADGRLITDLKREDLELLLS